MSENAATIPNLITWNDWAIRTFIIVVLSIQIGILGLIGADIYGFHAFIIRQLLGAIYITFIPGIILLRILRIHNIGTIETLIYSVALSLSVSMMLGFCIQIFSHSLGITNPLSMLPLLVSYTVLVLSLLFLCYIRDVTYPIPICRSFAHLLSYKVLFLCLIPFISILGAYLVNYYDSNTLLLLLIIVIAVTTILIGFKQNLPSFIYPLAIWIFSISLIYHNTLISPYLNIFDVVREFHYVNAVIQNHSWNVETFSTYNAMLSNVVIGPMFYYFCDLDLTWIFKILYPAIFSIVPLGLYHIFIKYVPRREAFLASFLFISLVGFYTTIPSTTKQSTAEVFLVAMLMILLGSTLSHFKKSVLLILFGASLIVSHYGTSYLFIISLVFVAAAMYVVNLQIPSKLLKKIEHLFKLKITLGQELPRNSRSISFTFVLFMLVFMVVWFSYVSNSAILISITNLGHHISNTIFCEFLSVDSSRGLEFLTRETPTLHNQLQKIYYLLMQVLIVVGFAKVLINRNVHKFDNVYLSMSLFWLLVLLCSIAISGFAMMNPLRLYHLSLFVLSPFAILGGVALLKLVWAGSGATSGDSSQKVCVLMCLLIVGFFLVSTGFVNVITDGPYKSLSLSKTSMNKNAPIEEVSQRYYNFMPEQDVFSAKWLSSHVNEDKKMQVYATLGHGEGRAALISYGMIPDTQIRMLPDDLNKIPGDAYIYLLYVNLMEGIGLGLNQDIGKPTAFEFSQTALRLESSNTIYTNKGSEVLLP